MNSTASGSERQGGAFRKAKAGGHLCFPGQDVVVDPHHLQMPVSLHPSQMLLRAESWRHELVQKRGDIPFSYSLAGKGLHVAPGSVGASALKCTGASSFS